MSDKISKHLTMGERFIILGSLPAPDFVTCKILRKLKETLSPTEEEIKSYEFENCYKCAHRDYLDKGKPVLCEYEINSKELPICPIHNEPMKPTGRVTWSPTKWKETKEIWFGVKANSLIIDALKAMEEKVKKDNPDLVLSLFEKFGDADDKEE